MGVVTLSCTFAAMCGLDGICPDNGPFDVNVVMDQALPIAELAINGMQPYPVTWSRPEFDLGNDAVHVFGGGGLFPPILLSFYGYDSSATVSVHAVAGSDGPVFSGTGSCTLTEGRGL